MIILFLLYVTSLKPWQQLGLLNVHSRSFDETQHDSSIEYLQIVSALLVGRSLYPEFKIITMSQEPQFIL